MLFPSLLLVLVVSATINSAPVEPEPEDDVDVQKIQDQVWQLIEMKWNRFLTGLVQKVYGPTNEPISRALLSKPIKQELYQKKVFPALVRYAEEAQWQVSKELFKQLLIQLGSGDMNADYEIPPMPENYATADFAITQEEKEKALNTPQSLYSISFAYRKAFVIAKRHAIEYAKEQLNEAVESGRPKYNEAKEEALETAQELRDNWNSEHPSKEVQGVKDTYTKLKDVYDHAKNALYKYWYKQPAEPKA